MTEQECVDRVIECLSNGRGGWIVTLNLDHLRRCGVDPDYARLILDADLRVADGMPLVWASRLRGTPLPERVAGSDLILSLSQAAGRRKMRVYLLGGNPGTAEAAVPALLRECPGLVIAGTACPTPGFENDARKVWELRRDLEAAAPDLIFVALGSPKQERLIRLLKPCLAHAWWVGVGISFSFVCGEVKRAPRWMQRSGLEWVHRLVQEPQRLASRYLVHGLPFAGRFLLGALFSRS
jgi:N-acetylglucosaminyldiphosphoundecaprenol N-acetyl-beta-D-mannosaminyltransferase